MSTSNSEKFKTAATVLKVIGTILFGVGILLRFTEGEGAG